MFILFVVNIFVCVAVTGQRRTSYGPRRMSLQSAAVGPGCALADYRDCCPYNITTSNDLDLIPRNLTAVYLVFSADHRVVFERGTLPEDLGGGARLRRLLMSVTYVRRGRLPPGVFVNLARLRSLQLYHDAPSSVYFSLRLSDGTFEGLSELVELVLARLGIENLPAGVFRGLRSICRLDLSQNRLAVVGSHVFRPPSVSAPGDWTENGCCRNLTTLLLGKNRFVNVADIRLSGLSSLRNVDLHKNAITGVRRDSLGARWNSTLGGFANVVHLNLGLNVIDRIEDGAFEGLVRLRVFYLDRNRISNVTASTFAGLAVLQTLDLDGNSISQLRSSVFAPLTSLRSLLVAENAMQVVETGRHVLQNTL